MILKQSDNNIIIAGAGFAGIRCALDLARAKRFLQGYEIILIDINNYHLFTPRLYQHATTGACRENLKIPLREILGKKPITFIQGKVEHIDQAKQQIRLDSGQKLYYRYLVLAIGNKVNYFSIPGIEKFSLSLKTHDDAERIYKQVKASFAAFAENHQAGEIFHVVIGGGGFSGVELAGEMHSFLKNLCTKTSKSEDDFTVRIIEGSDQLLPGQSQWVSRSAQARLGFYRRLEVALQSQITKATSDKIHIANGDIYDYHVLIWTGGVSVSGMVERCQLKLGRRCRIEVDPYLRAKGNQRIFGIGDCAIYRNPKIGQETSEVIIDAYRQGEVAAKNIIRLVNGRSLVKYQIKHSGHVIPIRGVWAISTIVFPLKGRLAYLLMRLVHLRYFLMILSLPQAIKIWRHNDYCAT